MNESKIQPEKINKPIQLLAAWLVGLILVNASFLMAAKQITHPDWASGALVISAILNVPAFLFSLFLLQTKFRPQMQEDAYYAKYLERENQFLSFPRPSTTEAAEKEVKEASTKIVEELGAAAKGKEEPIAEILRKSHFELLVAKHGRTRTLAELYLAPETWTSVVDQFSKDRSFIRDIEGLLEDGIAKKKYRGYRNVSLTDLGIKVAKEAESKGELFSQRSANFWERTRKQLAVLAQEQDAET